VRYYPNDGTDLQPTGSIPKGFGSNEVCRTHEQYVLEDLSNTGGTGIKGRALVHCDVIPPMGDLLKIGHIRAPVTEFPMELGPTKYTESMNSMFLRFYQTLEALGAKVGHWGAGIYSQT
jgi:hypothetical protein